ncbi:MAG: MJ0042-type zinc finger domain-containing protein [Alsobacter sp.]
MLIVCPNCATSYALTESQLGTGRTLRCAKCRHTWRATAADAVDGFAERADADAQAQWPPAAAQSDVATAEPPVAATGPRPPVRRGRAAARPRAKGIPVAAMLAKLRAVQPWHWALAGTAVALSLAVVERRLVVRLAPQTAALYAAVHLPVNLRGLAFEGVRSQVIADKDQQILVVEGQIRNVTKDDSGIPGLALSLRDEKGSEIYSWTAETPRSVLAPGESAPFRARLVAPPLDGRDVLVRFARNENDAPADH